MGVHDVHINRSERSGLRDQPSGQQGVRPQEVIHVPRVQVNEGVVGGERVLDFLDFSRRRENGLTAGNRRDLSLGQLVALDRGGRMHRVQTIGAPQLQPPASHVLHRTDPPEQLEDDFDPARPVGSRGVELGNHTATAFSGNVSNLSR